MRGNKEIKRLVTIWALRAVLRPNVFGELFSTKYFDDDIKDALDFEALGIDEAELATQRGRNNLKKVFRDKLHQVESANPPGRCRFFRNISRLGEHFSLSKTEKEVLVFSLLAKEHSPLRLILEAMGETGLSAFFRELSYLIGYKPSQTRKALESDGTLCVSGLLRLSKGSSEEIQDRIEPLDGLVDAVMHGSGDITSLLSRYCSKAPAPKLRRSNFPHLSADLEILYPFLSEVLKAGTPGSNILLYGPPGTGKTELARVIAKDLKADLQVIGHEDDDGDPASDDVRFRSYFLTQRMFAKSREVIVLFDEIEDVFPSFDFDFFGFMQRSGNHKAWTNRILESNPVPAIWISNSVDQIDPAFIRRFAMVVEVPIPPKSVRKRMLGEIVKDIPTSPEWLDEMAGNENLSPSNMEKAAGVVRVIGASDSQTGEKIMNRIISESHKAMGFHWTANTRRCDEIQYEPRFLNADVNLDGLVDALKSRGEGRVCLYGPPGSGKSRFVGFIAEKLDRPLVLKRASDILGAYIGETEKRIASLFEEAAQEDSILFLDEADSFLRGRDRADKSWEVTQVNELLVQMENFKGICFFATNFMNSLDSAVFRRFDLKIKLDYLKPLQALELFKAVLLKEGIVLTESEAKVWETQLAPMDRLTPGDFATVKRSLFLTGKGVKAESLFDGLKAENSVKPGGSGRKLGF